MGPSKILQTRLQNLILCKHTIEESAISQIPFIKALPIFRCQSFRKNLNDMFSIFRPISSSLLLFNNAFANSPIGSDHYRIHSAIGRISPIIDDFLYILQELLFVARYASSSPAARMPLTDTTSTHYLNILLDIMMNLPP